MKIAEFLMAATECKIGRKKVSSAAFLNHYREYLLGFPGIRSKVETCFRAIEAGRAFPTAMLAQIVGLISTESEPKPIKIKDPKAPKEVKFDSKGKKIKAPKEEKEPKESKKRYVITIEVKDDPYKEGKWSLGQWEGNHRPEDITIHKRVIDKDSGLPVWKEVKANFFTAETYQEAMGIADRKLDQNENSVYADITGLGVMTRVHRTDAVARVHAKKKSAATKRVAKVSASLGWGMRTKDFKQHFSGC